ncbi:hypothetical protein TSOC_009903 [Tetrabaena socialis]|uniref:Uncharacterized protein n=1 Tax=Tetrabaena socialis TaxID=47790 RepID=A0A2J7ZUP5_9CHLO|nr:hypothetical protein TSOC_009903 [Tetrabaena socialis]|eukprot:PNH03991.1 hypothetical protein TSOC_009903 [Tetrabaena socialis]
MPVLQSRGRHRGSEADQQRLRGTPAACCDGSTQSAASASSRSRSGAVASATSKSSISAATASPLPAWRGSAHSQLQRQHLSKEVLQPGVVLVQQQAGLAQQRPQQQAQHRRQVAGGARPGGQHPAQQLRRLRRLQRGQAAQQRGRAGLDIAWAEEVAWAGSCASAPPASSLPHPSSASPGTGGATAAGLRSAGATEVGLLRDQPLQHLRRRSSSIQEVHLCLETLRPAVILVEPQMGANIGAAARALKNFGLIDLRLVAPRDGWPNPDADATASHAADLAAATVLASWTRIRFYFLVRLVGEGSARLTPETLAIDDDATREERLAYTFLYNNMPEADKADKQLGFASFIAPQTRMALQARADNDWATDGVPWNIFLNYVLPYANLDEPREDWRSLFYSKFAPLVADTTGPLEAAMELNDRRVHGLPHNAARPPPLGLRFPPLEFTPWSAHGKQQYRAIGNNNVPIDAAVAERVAAKGWAPPSGRRAAATTTGYRFCEDEASSQGGQGVFVAVRPIQPGEMITTCYLGWDEQTLMSTRMRRQLLARTKLFHCSCARCSSGLDLYRSLPCPGCAGATVEAEAAAAEAVEAAKGAAAAAAEATEAREGDAAGMPAVPGAPLPQPQRPVSRWTLPLAAEAELRPRAVPMRKSLVAAPPVPMPEALLASQCGRSYGEEEVRAQLRRRAAAAGLPALAAGDPEAVLEEEVTAVGEQLDWCDIAVSLGAVRRLGAACLKVLGPRHWTTNRCRYTVLGLSTAALAAMCGGDGASSVAAAAASTAVGAGSAAAAASTADPTHTVAAAVLHPPAGNGRGPGTAGGGRLHTGGGAADGFGCGAGGGCDGIDTDGGDGGGGVDSGGGDGGVAGSGGGVDPHVNPHLGREQLLQHTLHHHSLHLQAQQEHHQHHHQRQQLQEQQAWQEHGQQQQEQQQQQAQQMQSLQPAQQQGHHQQQQQELHQVLPPPSPPPANGAAAASAVAPANGPLGPSVDCGGCGDIAATASPAAAPACETGGSVSGGFGARGGVASGGGAFSLSSTVWSVVEADALVLCICEELQALWQWQQHHTPDDPAVVLKAVARPAATALMDAVKDEVCSGGRVASLALAVAEATGARLVAAYAAAPYFDVSGEECAEAVSVVELCPLIRRALDIE